MRKNWGEGFEKSYVPLHGGRGVKNCQNHSYVINDWPITTRSLSCRGWTIHFRKDISQKIFTSLCFEDILTAFHVVCLDFSISWVCFLVQSFLPGCLDKKKLRRFRSKFSSAIKWESYSTLSNFIFRASKVIK